MHSIRGFRHLQFAEEDLVACLQISAADIEKFLHLLKPKQQFHTMLLIEEFHQVNFLSRLFYILEWKTFTF